MREKWLDEYNKRYIALRDVLQILYHTSDLTNRTLDHMVQKGYELTDEEKELVNSELAQYHRIHVGQPDEFGEVDFDVDDDTTLDRFLRRVIAYHFDLIKALPNADIRAITYCRECEHCTYNPNDDTYYCENLDLDVDETFYCGDAK